MQSKHSSTGFILSMEWTIFTSVTSSPPMVDGACFIPVYPFLYSVASQYSWELV
jgi:hypothetical protein